MHLRPAVALVSLGLALGACGGGVEGEPLLVSELSAEYAGEAFTPVFGFATITQDVGLIALGDGPIRCGTEDDSEPPSGTNAAITLPALEVGSYGSVFVQLFHNEGDFEGIGSNGGSVTITAASADSVAGSVEYDYTDDEARHFLLSGTFDAVRCAP